RAFVVTNPDILYKPYVLSDKEGSGKPDIRVFFRDCHLSDLIGFHYRKMPYKKAAADLVERIKRVPGTSTGEMVVPIILDGENAWEFYSHSGRPFLREFFRLVSEDESLEAVTFSEAAKGTMEPGFIDFNRYSAGSWINGNFDIWIGDEEDRRGWRLLEKARNVLESKKAGLPEDRLAEARTYLSIAQGSDWFWWFGKENYTADLDIFDNLFRRNMQKVFELMDEEVPEEFYVPVSTVSAGRGAGVS
ncbi:MAG: glycoside hydrolase, partial [bacterium]|nr:glycoside hydrolase [bacterium]